MQRRDFMDILQKADVLMFEFGLMKILRRYGDVFTVGSYNMGIMTWNDLDFYFDNSRFDRVDYSNLVTDIIKEMLPVRFEGLLNKENNQLFLGFETMITGERWNVDIWWKTKEEIQNSFSYSRDLVAQMECQPELKSAVLRIKQGLIKNKLYGMDKGRIHYHSKDIYDAVFKENIYSTEQFLFHHPK